jgi:dihydrofolate reductase
MGGIVVFESITLDGVMQAPGRPDEDSRGGFDRGGWATRYADEVMAEWSGSGMGGSGGLLLGRRTYLDFYGFWPNQADNPYTEVLNRATKYVASRTLQAPLPWQNSVLLPGDAMDALADVLPDVEGDLVVLGSGSLVRALAVRGLVDRYVLLVHPLVLGRGRRLFPEDGPSVDLRLVDSAVTTTGVFLGSYVPAGR